jgi:hypothetical protein
MLKLIKVFVFLGLLAAVSCKNNNNTSITNKIQQPLEKMGEKWHYYLAHFSQWDSMQQQLNLTTLRYELQGLQYEIEIIFIPPNDSLNWVAGQYVAATFFDMSWNELPKYIQAFNQNDSIAEKKVLDQMNRKEQQAIDYYLKHIRPFSEYNNNYWKNHFEEQHSD